MKLWKKGGSQKRHICTMDDPWDDGMGPAVHPDAEFMWDENDGVNEYDRYICPWCGTQFKETVAD